MANIERTIEYQADAVSFAIHKGVKNKEWLKSFEGYVAIRREYNDEDVPNLEQLYERWYNAVLA